MPALPIACTLDPAALEERRALLRQVLGGVTEVIRSPTGLVLRFGAGGVSVAGLGRIIELERACCPFLEFRLDVASNNEAVVLHLTGPDGSGEFLVHELGIPGNA